MWNGYNDWDNDKDDANERNGLAFQINRNESRIKEIEKLIQPLKKLREENAGEEELICQELDRQIGEYNKEINSLKNDIEFCQSRLTEIERERD